MKPKKLRLKKGDKNKQIYIVDDDESVCRSLDILLVTHGFTVKTFTSAD